MHVKWLMLFGTILLQEASAAGLPPAFTAAQSKAGQAVYTANCQSCHGNNLQGGAGPALMGKLFAKKWNGKKLDDLHYIIHTLMPLDKPNSLSDAQYLNVTTFILQKNGLKAGTKPLTKAALKNFTLSLK